MQQENEAVTTPAERGRPKMYEFGSDHWSTLIYIETRCVDHKGLPDRENMRTDRTLHPGLAHRGSSGKFPTRLRGGVLLADHDDWSCLEDFEFYGILNNVGTGINPRYVLTERGWALAHALRRRLAEGKDTKDFNYKTVLGPECDKHHGFGHNRECRFCQMEGAPR